jgi:hypothetical protein
MVSAMWEMIPSHDSALTGVVYDAPAVLLVLAGCTRKLQARLVGRQVCHGDLPKARAIQGE